MATHGTDDGWALARAIYRARRRLFMSQERVALEAGLHPKTVHLVESAKVDPRLSTVVRIAVALHVPVTDLLAGLEQGITSRHDPR